MYKLILALGLLPSVFAAEYTTTLLLVGFESQSIVGSVIATDATATTYSLTCAQGADSLGCGIPPDFSFTQGPSTMLYSISGENTVVGCEITSDHGVCSGSAVSVGPSSFGASGYMSSYSNSGLGIGAQVVTITASAAPGASASAANSVTSTSATTTGALSEQTSSSSTGSTTSALPGETDTSSSSSSSVSTGGMPMVTGNAHWVVGGAAVAVALAAM